MPLVILSTVLDNNNPGSIKNINWAVSVETSPLGDLAARFMFERENDYD